MGKMPRKDYATANGNPKDVAKNNEVLKRVNTQNAPQSIQATGHDLKPDRITPMTAENLDALTKGARLLDVSREKYVKSVTKSVVPGSESETVSMVVTFKHEDGTPKDQTYTRQELLSSGTIFIAKPEL